MPMLGKVEIDLIEKVSAPKSTKSSEHALEDGEPIADHVESEAKTISISGEIHDPTGQKEKMLDKYMEDGEILLFNFVTRLENVIITSFTPDWDASIKNGFAYSMTLKQIRIARKASTVKVSGDTAKRTAAPTNAGRKQVTAK